MPAPGAKEGIILGKQALERISGDPIKSKPETRLIPVVLLTSLAGDDDRIRGIMCGADDFLSKPVTKRARDDYAPQRAITGL